MLCERLRALVALESDPRVGSLLLRYDPSDGAMEGLIRAEIDAVMAAMPPAGQTEPGHSDAANADDLRHRRHIHTRATINRVAKIGALGGMVASLAALGVSRRLHAQIGVFAALMTLTHATMHWRRIVR